MSSPLTTSAMDRDLRVISFFVLCDLFLNNRDTNHQPFQPTSLRITHDTRSDPDS